MRLALKYPNVFSVVAATGGAWDFSPEALPGDLKVVQSLKELPKEVSDLDDVTIWWVQLATAAAPDPDNPPFYGAMPFRIVGGRGEDDPASHKTRDGGTYDLRQSAHLCGQT